MDHPLHSTGVPPLGLARPAEVMAPPCAAPCGPPLEITVAPITHISLKLLEEGLLVVIALVIVALDSQRGGPGRVGSLPSRSLLCLGLNEVLQALVVDPLILRGESR